MLYDRSFHLRLFNTTPPQPRQVFPTVFDMRQWIALSLQLILRTVKIIAAPFPHFSIFQEYYTQHHND